MVQQLLRRELRYAPLPRAYGAGALEPALVDYIQQRLRFDVRKISMQPRNVIPSNGLTSLVITGISILSITHRITEGTETNFSEHQGEVSAKEPHKRPVVRSQGHDESGIICQNLGRDFIFLKIIDKDDKTVEGVIEVVRRNAVKLLLRKTRHDMNNRCQPVMPFAFGSRPGKFQGN